MKKWFTSKTIIVNVLTLAAGLLAVVAGTDWIMANPQTAATLTSIIAAVNIALRLFTSKAIRI